MAHGGSRMRLFHWLFAACCSAFLAGGCRTLDDRLLTARSPREIVQATADFYVQDLGDECCVVAHVTTNGVVYGRSGPADEHALFRLASLSKLFLHPVILELAENGRIDLDRPVSDCSKLELPPEYATVTLRDLLDNRSGLPREFLMPWTPWDMWTCFRCGLAGIHIYGDFDSRENFAKTAWRPWWRACVRDKRDVYSNVGFGLLGTVLEDALGMTLEDLIRDELVRPMRLQDTTYEPEPLFTNRLTRARAGCLPWLTRRGHDVPDHRLGSALRATGGLFSSIADCARVFTAYWKIVDAQMAERSIGACADDAVFGLLRVKVLPSGRRVLYRAGMIYGGSSFVGFDPVDRTILVILRNVTSWPDRRGFAVLDALRRSREREEANGGGKTNGREVVASQGLEPQQAESESAVLPLHHEATWP